jgi:hypothetical protein
MRLGELLDREVLDRDGRVAGRVKDVRLVQGGPLRGQSCMLRLDGLVVGPRTAPLRLGYHRREVRKPALLRWLFHRAARGARFVPMSEVDSLGGDHVRLRCAADALPHLHDETSTA